MIIDFGLIKSSLCAYLEEKWDHKFMIWEKDPLLGQLKTLVPEDIVIVPFNPTAENMARYIVEEIGPILLDGTDVTLCSCRVEETRKCSATYSL